MEFTTIQEMIQVFLAYSFCAFFVPYFIFRKHYPRTATLGGKFLISTVIGNFYMINVVYFIFLLKIGNRYTLILFTLIPAVLAYLKYNRPAIGRFFAMLYQTLVRCLYGEARLHAVFQILFYPIKKSVRKAFRKVKRHFRSHIFEWLLILILLLFNVWYYSYQTINDYGYGTSDLVVHNSWLNAMDSGKIFAKGIYPFGYHNVIYFLHAIFKIDFYVLLRVFAPVYTVFIYLMLYIFLRQVCKSKYTPILGLYFFSVPNLFHIQSTMRFQWTLPQEFAVLFLYPCGYFLLQYFNRKYNELQTEKQYKKEGRLYSWLALYHLRPSTISLMLFAMSFSMTFAVHFYITIVAFLLCAGIALCYVPMVLRIRCLSNILTAGILSMLIAVAPLGIAYAQGAPMEGSLDWAISEMHSNKNTAAVPSTGSAAVATGSSTVASGVAVSSGSSAPAMSVREKSARFFRRFFMIEGLVFIRLDYAKVFLYALFSGLLLCIIMTLFRRGLYYRNAAGLLLYTVFLLILQCSAAFGLPTLMDIRRTRIFLVYAIPVAIALIADILCRPLSLPLQRRGRFREIPALLLSIALVTVTLSQDGVKPLSLSFALQSKGEMLCNYNIIRNFPEQKWTIVSTTEDLQIIGSQGWHTEITDFLSGMNQYSEDSLVQIPTPYVFFYIEKKPLRYADYYTLTEEIPNLGTISSQAARRKAEYIDSNAYHQGNRNILESKFYYWAQAFHKLYPNEFKKYYEDDDFICYFIRQNEYHLYNFAIDYGYND